MKKNTDTYYFTYNVFGKPVTVNFNGAEYTYVKNFQGDIVGILDASGNMVVEYMYDAWGNAISIYSASMTVDSLAFDNPFRYRGYVWDEETGLYYLRSRYYNPEWGRFLNGDSLVGDIGKINSHNTFIYCNNMPTIMADYDGLYPLQFANELLNYWLNGKNNVIIFEEDSRIVKLLKKSEKVKSHIQAAIEDYKKVILTILDLMSLHLKKMELNCF